MINSTIFIEYNLYDIKILYYVNGVDSKTKEKYLSFVNFMLTFTN